MDKNKLNKPISQLSNGERQRFAVICSMMVEAWLYIYDEPTSSLDSDHAKLIISLIKEMVSDQKMIVLSLHDRTLLDDGHIYVLENHKINEQTISNPSIHVASPIKNNPIKKSLLFKQGLNHLGHSPFINSFSIIILSIVIAFSTLFAAYGSQLSSAQMDTLNNVYEKELFVINASSARPIKNYNFIEFLNIPTEQLNKLKSIEHVSQIYPHISFKLRRHVEEKYTFKAKMLSDPSYENINIIKDNTLINQVSYKDIFMQSLTIDPVYPHQKIVERSEVLDSSIKEGFYISSVMAQKLGIKELNGEEIKLSMTIPIAANPGVIEDTNELVRDSVCTLKEIQLPIKGILKRTTMNSYHLTEPHLFLDYDVMENIMNEANQENLEWLQEVSTKPMEHTLIKEVWPTLLIDTKWEASAYIVEVDSIENIDQVKSDIQKINPNFAIRGLQVNGQMTKDIIEQQKSIITLFTGALMIVVIILSLIIRYFKSKKSTHYYQYLSRIGFSTTSILQIIFIEMLAFTLLVIPFTLLFSHLIRDLISLPMVFNQYFFIVMFIEILVMMILLNKRYKE